MNSKRFRQFIERDGGCIHCGELEAIAPHHRLNRGMGGSKQRDNPANIIVLCSVLNGLLESNSKWAHTARIYGWKLIAGEDPAEVAVYYPVAREWMRLSDDWGRKVIVDC